MFLRLRLSWCQPGFKVQAFHGWQQLDRALVTLMRYSAVMTTARELLMPRNIWVAWLITLDGFGRV
jgi:hypothetical protein